MKLLRLITLMWLLPFPPPLHTDVKSQFLFKNSILIKSTPTLNLNFPAKNGIIEKSIFWTKIGILPQCALHGLLINASSQRLLSNLYVMKITWLNSQLYFSTARNLPLLFIPLFETSFKSRFIGTKILLFPNKLIKFLRLSNEWLLLLTVDKNLKTTT